MSDKEVEFRTTDQVPNIIKFKARIRVDHTGFLVNIPIDELKKTDFKTDLEKGDVVHITISKIPDKGKRMKYKCPNCGFKFDNFGVCETADGDDVYMCCPDCERPKEVWKENWENIESVRENQEPGTSVTTTEEFFKGEEK